MFLENAAEMTFSLGLTYLRSDIYVTERSLNENGMLDFVEDYLVDVNLH